MQQSWHDLPYFDGKTLNFCIKKEAKNVCSATFQNF